MALQNIILDPSEVAIEGRKELPLEGGGIRIFYEGLDFGDQEVKAFMAEGRFGSRPIDHDWPQRTIKIPLVIRAYGSETFDDIRVKLQAWTSAVANDGGGWLKRILPSGRHIFADIVEAKLHLSSDWTAENRKVDRSAMLELQALADFYGDKKTGPIHEFTGDGSWTEQIEGDLPGRVVDLAVEDKSGSDQYGLMWHFRRDVSSEEEGASWVFDAEDLMPMDQASIANLSGASPAGSSTNNIVEHKALGTDWTPMLSLTRSPKVRAVGAAVAGTGGVTPPLPTGVQKDDILIMYLETENQAVTAPTGWTQVHAPSITTGTPTRLTVLWKRAVAGEAAPNVPDPGDHVIARIIAVSGCIKTGNPWNVTGQGTEETSDTSVEFVSVTTTVDQCLVLQAASTGVDVSSTAHASAWANSNLQAVTERMDNWTAEGAGGGFAVASGLKIKAGAIGATTATVGTAAPKAQSTIALRPAEGGNALELTGVFDVWARVRSTSGKLPWLRLLSGFGDLVGMDELQQRRIPGLSAFFMLYLGQVSYPAPSFGPQRGQGVIQARGEDGGEMAQVDRLYFQSVGDSCGVLSAQMSPRVGVTGFDVRDEFEGAKAVLNERSIPDGSGKWATSGATGDFETDGAGSLIRTKTADTANRIATPPGGPYKVVAAKLEGLEWSDVPHESGIGTVDGGLRTGLHAFGAHFCLVHEGFGSGKAGVALDEVQYIEAWTHTQPLTLQAGKRYSFTMLAVGGHYVALWIDIEGVPVSAPLVVPISTAEGKIELLDEYDGYSTPVTRRYGSFRRWVPPLDAVIYANRDCHLSERGMFRSTNDGSGYGAVNRPGADLPRIPVSGPKEAPVEIALKTSRGDFSEAPDGGLDKFAAQHTYQPCWSSVPTS